MKRSDFPGFIFCFALVACASRGAVENQTISGKASVDLPNISFVTLTGERFQGKDLVGKSVILILFQPDCDHCQREAREIKEHIQSFRQYQLYFVTNTAAAEVGDFAKNYQLSEEPNVVFALTDLQSILTHFGSIPTPSLYIYNVAGKLIQKFNGETDINHILKAL